MVTPSLINPFYRLGSQPKPTVPPNVYVWVMYVYGGTAKADHFFGIF